MEKSNEVLEVVTSFDESATNFITKRDERLMAKEVQVVKPLVHLSPEKDFMTKNPTPDLDEQGNMNMADVLDENHVLVIFENDDVKIVVTHNMPGPQGFYHRGLDMDEINFQIGGELVTKTEMGDYPMRPGDFLLLPRGVAHRNFHDSFCRKLVIYTKKPLALSKQYQALLDKRKAQ